MAYENLVDIIENSDNIVFQEEQGYLLKAIYLILEVLMVCMLPKMSTDTLQKL